MKLFPGCFAHEFQDHDFSTLLRLFTIQQWDNYKKYKTNDSWNKKNLTQKYKQLKKKVDYTGRKFIYITKIKEGTYGKIVEKALVSARSLKLKGDETANKLES